MPTEDSPSEEEGDEFAEVATPTVMSVFGEEQESETFATPMEAGVAHYLETKMVGSPFFKAHSSKKSLPVLDTTGETKQPDVNLLVLCVNTWANIPFACFDLKRDHPRSNVRSRRIRQSLGGY